MKKFFFVLAAVFLLCFGGCTTLNIKSSEIIELQNNVTQLQNELKNTQAVIGIIILELDKTQRGLKEIRGI